MTRVAIYVELTAKPGREEDVARFLAGARDLIMAETGTVAWFAVRFDNVTFAIFDAFNEEAGRAAHLNGAVAAALMANASELLAKAPEIRQPSVLADKLPS
ncbi:antibiotic biosynthesis monooxygenase [Bradyrhizobium sp. Pear77]|uniref:putative quinol monooxygenase n=1 Tax=Bradyrhizobium altum TaxID=1571202 RepID=UPI001E611781|nr:antibiotic biosynthesis monooxygenase [Bradyrhizobium altum]MCC8953385.1 antibiotic biosynthesis monooxygenase [Bradyrhizobium altum]